MFGEGSCASAVPVLASPLQARSVPVAPHVGGVERHDHDMARPAPDLLVATRAHVLLAGLEWLNAVELGGRTGDRVIDEHAGERPRLDPRESVFRRVGCLRRLARASPPRALAVARSRASSGARTSSRLRHES